MRVAFLLHSLGLSGGVGVVVGHARRLRLDHGFDAQLVLSSAERAADWTHAGLVDVPIRTLGDATSERWDVAVATWWETVFVVHELPAERYAYFVQSMEERFYGSTDPARAAASLTHDLPLGLITEARWIAAQLQARRPAGRVFYARNGIDKAVFAPAPMPPTRRNGPIRILIEGDLSAPAKGVREALEAAAQMREPRAVTLVTNDPDAEVTAQADRIVGPLSLRQMAEEYGRSDVMLKLSRVEGMSAPPLEAFHKGATCVVTPVTGHDEYVDHGWNGLVVHWEDLRGTSRALDLLACDQSYLHFLRVNALATARAWPSQKQSTAMMALAIRRIRAEPSPDPTRSAAQLAADARGAMEFYSALQRDHERLRARIARVESALSRGPVLRAARKIARNALLGRESR
jgi:glycosyltransferase involved in cell wall biosynthesis